MQAAVSQQSSLYGLTLTSLDFDWKWNAHWIAPTIEAPQFVAFHSQWLIGAEAVLWRSCFLFCWMPRQGSKGLVAARGWAGSSAAPCPAGIAMVRELLGDLKPQVMWSFPRTAWKRGGTRRVANIGVWGEIVCIWGVQDKVSHSLLTFSFVSHSRRSSLYNLKFCKVVLSLQWWRLKSYLIFSERYQLQDPRQAVTPGHPGAGAYLLWLMLLIEQMLAVATMIFSMNSEMGQRRVIKCKWAHNRSDTSPHYTEMQG